MFAKLKELRDQRGNTVKNMRAILEKAEAEKRELSAEEQVSYDKAFADQERTGKQIADLEKLVEAERQMAQSELEARDARSKTDPAAGGDQNAATRLKTAWRNYLSTGEVRGEGAEELRALQAGSNPDGGYLVTPQEVVNTLIKFIDDQVFIRGRATKFTVPQAASLGAPSLDADPADADWTTELGTGNEDSNMKFGKRELYPQPVAKRIKISKKLLRLNPAVDSLVMQRLAYKFGITQEKAFLTGDGNKKPLGVFTASPHGIPTTRDVSTGNTTTAITFDGLIEAKFSVKPGYWPTADWLFHRDAVKMVTKLKDGDGQYLWRQSVRDGEPDMLLGRPLMISEYAPNTFTTGLYVGLFGDFTNYWIADALDMQTQVLTELYAETNQNGYIGRMETDGMPVLPEAFARVKLA